MNVCLCTFPEKQVPRIGRHAHGMPAHLQTAGEHKDVFLAAGKNICGVREKDIQNNRGVVKFLQQDTQQRLDKQRILH